VSSETLFWLWFFLCPLAYVSGSVPSGLLLGRWCRKADIRRMGSRNIGATNVMRHFGTALGILTLVGDSSKGAVPTALAMWLTSSWGIWREPCICLVCLSAFLGHLYPLFTRMRGGGKGVATAAGCLVLLSPKGVVLCLLVFVLMVCLSDRVSVGSLSASAVLPATAWYDTGSAFVLATAVVMAVLIWQRHLDNIGRLLSGTEPPLRRQGTLQEEDPPQAKK